MPNVQISDLPFATIPLVGATTFFEVEVTEGGVVVSRRVAADDLVISATTLFIDGTSTDDPAIGGGVFDGQLLWRNANAQQTGVFGFDPAGDNFIWSNDAEGGFHQIAIRDGTVLVETIAAAAGGLLVNNLITGAGLERVLTTADFFAGPVGTSTDDPESPGTFDAQLQWENALGDPLANLGYNAAISFDINNVVHGGGIRLRGETVGGALETYLQGAAGSGTILFFAGLQKIVTTADSIIVNDASTNDPTAGGNQSVNIELRNGSFQQAASYGFEDNDVALILYNRVHGGKTIIRGESDAGEIRDVIDIDYSSAGGFIIFREPNGTRELMRLDTGINAVTQKANITNQPSGGFAQVGVLRVENRNASPEVSMFVGFNETIGTTTLRLKNFVHGGPLELVGETAAGVERVLFFHDPDQVGPIFVGILDNDPTVDASIQDARMTFRNPSADNIWQIGFLDGDNNFSIKLFQDTGFLSLRGSTTLGADVLFFRGDPDGNTNIYHNQGVGANLAINTNNLGITVSGVGTTTIVELVRQTDGMIVGEMFHSGGEFALEAGIDVEALMNLYATDTALNEVIMATLDAQAGPVTLNHSDAAGNVVAGIRTSSLANGGAEVNNTVTGAGFERVLTIGDLGGAAASGVSPFDIASAAAADPTLTLTEDATLSTTLLHDVSTDITIIRNEVNSGHVQIRGRNSSGGDALMASFDPDNQTQLYWDEDLRLRTGQIGLEIIGSGATSSVERFFQSNGTTLMGTFGFGSSTHSWSGLVDGAAIQLQSNDAGSVSRLILRGDPDNTTALYHAGEIQIITRDDGMEVRGEGNNNPATGGTQDFFLRFVNDAIAEIGGIEFSASIDMTLTNRVHGGNILIRGEDGGGVLQTMIDMDPDADVGLFFDGAITLRTTVEGFDLLGSSATAGSLILFSADGLTERGVLSFDTAGVKISSRVNSLGVAIRVLNGAGVEQTVFSAAGSTGTVSLRFTGLVRFETNSQGVLIRGNGTTNVVALFEGSAGLDMFAMRGETTRTIWDSIIDSNLLVIRGNNSVSAATTCAEFDPDDDVELFDAGTGVIRTQQAGLGGAEVNNTFTGAGYERVLTNTDADNLSIFTRNAADDNVPSATFVNGVLTISLAANETYAFEFYFEFQTPNASGDDFVLRFDNQAGWAGTVVVTCDNDAGTEHFSMDVGGAPATSITVNSDTTSNTVCKGIGVIVTDGTPGTFELDVAKSADAGGDGTFFANSWMRVQLLTV